MALGFGKRHRQPEATTTTEPLVDINPKPAASDETGTQLKPRRKRLSDMQDQPEEPQPEPKTQRRCLSDVAQTEPGQPAPKLPALSGRPRLSIAQPHVAVMEAPDEPGMVPIYDGAPACVPCDKATPAKSPAASSAIEATVTQRRDKPCLPIAVAGGLLATVVGAMLWAVVTTMTSFHIAWMAIPLGLLVGGVIRTLGRGLDRSFGCLGAILVAFGCLLGSHLTNCMFIARDAGLATTAVLTQVNPAAIVRLLTNTFHPLDPVFYGLAIYGGYRLSFRRISRTRAAESKSRTPCPSAA